jgi:purine-binding chemotaxis protein CheW
MEKNEKTVSGTTADGNQFLTFILGAEEYGIEILKVQEIKGYTAFTPIPNAPAYIKGVINLRGTVVPVVDLRTKFAMSEAEYNQFTVVIVVTVGTRVIGLVVDAVSDVMNIPHEAIEAAPHLGRDVDTSFMTGMAKSNDKLIALLDIDKLIGEDVLGTMAATH